MTQLLGIRTEKEYRRILKLAFGTDDAEGFQFRSITNTKSWSASRRVVLAAAIAWAFDAAGLSREDAKALAHRVAPRDARRARKVTRGLGSAEMLVFEERMNANLDEKERAFLTLMYKLGLRSDEVLMLERGDIRRALREPYELVIMRKGRKEQPLPSRSAKVQAALQALLNGKPISHRPGDPWTIAWELLSTSRNAAYQKLWVMCKEMGELAGIKGMRPHLLRHRFASELDAKGVPTRQIQALMGHENISTTERYIHVETKTLEKYIE